MTASQMWMIGMGLALGLASTVTLLLLWWVGWNNGWEIHASWNLYYEAWVEGIILHAIALFLLVMLWQVKKWRVD